MSEVLQPLESVKSGCLASFQGYGTTVQCRSHYCLCRVRRLNISSVWKKDEQPDFTKWTISWCRECYLRCDCEPSLGMAVWCVGKPIVRPEPTSTVHAQSWKMRPVGLAVITGVVVYYLVPTGTLAYSSQVSPLYDCRCTIQPHLAWTLHWWYPVVWLCHVLLVMPCYLYVIILVYLE